MGRSRGAAIGAVLALGVALAACTPVESLDEEGTTPAESVSESVSEEPTSEEPTSEEPTSDEPEPTSEEPEEETTEEPAAPTTDSPDDAGGAEEPGDGADDAGRVVVEHEAGTVSYVLPDGWNDLTFAYEGHPTVVLGAAPLATAQNGTQLTLTAIPGGATDFDAYHAALEAQRPPEAVMVEADPITVAGSSVRGLRVEMDSPSGSFVQYTYPVFRGSYLWELQFAMDGGDEAGDLPGLVSVAGSIRFE